MLDATVSGPSISSSDEWSVKSTKVGDPPSNEIQVLIVNGHMPDE